MTGNDRLRFLDMQLCICYPQNELEGLQEIEWSGDNGNRIQSTRRNEAYPH
jgi:hypothetical protein